MYDELSRQGASPQILNAKASMLSYCDLRGQEHLMFSTSSDKSAATGLLFAGNKARTAVITSGLGISIPDDKLCTNFSQVLAFFKNYKKIVLKPAANSGGKGVTINITATAELKRAYKFAKAYGKEVIAQQHLEGDDIRLLVVAGTFISAVQRKPAYVVGDGELCVKALVILENLSIARNDPENLSLLPIDMTAVKRYLGDQIYMVPRAGKKVRVVGPANISLGGTLCEATQLVNQSMIADAENITSKLKLGICGVDIIWNQSENTYGVIEVNATPGIDIHDDPYSGTSSNAATKYAQWLIA